MEGRKRLKLPPNPSSTLVGSQIQVSSFSTAQHLHAAHRPRHLLFSSFSRQENVSQALSSRSSSHDPSTISSYGLCLAPEEINFSLADPLPLAEPGGYPEDRCKTPQRSREVRCPGIRVQSQALEGECRTGRGNFLHPSGELQDCNACWLPTTTPV